VPPRSQKQSSPNPDSLWETIQFGAGILWSAGRGNCIAMGAGALVSALLAPVTVVVLAMLVSEISSILADGASNSETLTFWIIIAAAAAFVGIVVGSFQRYSKLRLRDSLSLKMQREVLTHAASLDASVLDDRRSQDILARARKDPGQTVLKLLNGLIETVSGSIQLLSLAGVLIWIEPWWSLGLLAAVIPFVVSAYFISRVRHQRNRIKTTRRRWTRYYSKLLTHRESASAVKILSLAPLMLDRHHHHMQDLTEDNRRIGRLEVGLNLVASLVLLIVISGALYVAAQKAATGTLEIGAFSAFWMAVWKFRAAASKVGGSVSGIQGARLAIGDLKEFFALRPRMQDDGTQTPKINGKLEFKNVSFQYTEDAPPVLEDVSLTILPGETVALVGPNGAGKSTLAKLISRLYEPTSGEFLIDGMPANEIQLRHYYDSVSMVFQSPNRYEATAGENIAFGNWNELKDDPAQVRRVAEIAGVDKVIDELPDGYDTVLGRMFGEWDLSGGQWKKIAIAQALAADPRVVILDEPAANLDFETESLLHCQLRTLLKDRTTVLISHRFSTVRMADRIIVIVNGRIVEQGTHTELLGQAGLYAAMCQSHRCIIEGDEPKHTRSSTEILTMNPRDELRRDQRAA